MARGTVLAEILLEGGRTFRRSVEASGDQMDDAARDAGTLSGALSYAGDQLQDIRGTALGAAFGFGRVAAQADDAGDELVEAGGKASAASGLFSTASIGTYGLSLSLGTLSTTITAVAIPALAALSTTLVPLTATLSGFVAAGAGLAGALGAVVGSGALAYGEDLNKEYQEQLLRVEDQIEALEEQEDAQGSLTDAQRKELKQLKDRKQELNNVEGAFSALQVKLGDVAEEIGGIVAEWGSGFAPLVRDGINALPTLVRNVLDAVGGLGEFRKALRTIGGIAMNALPGVASALVDVGREALPFFIDGLRWLRENGGSIFDRIMQTTRTVAPLLQDVAGAFVDNLPAINRFGTGLLQRLLPAIGDAIDGFGNLLTQIMEFTRTEQFREIMSEVRAGMDELGPELAELRKNFGSLFQTLVENGPAIVRGLVGIADSVLDIVNALTPVLEFFINLVGDAADAWSEWVERSEQQEQNLAQQGILGYLGSGIADNLPNASTQRPQTGPQAELRRELNRTRQQDQQVDVRIDVRSEDGTEADVDAQINEREQSRARRSTRNDTIGL